MIQVYVLSIVSLMIAGLFLSADFLSKRLKWLSGLASKTGFRAGRITVGAITVVVGVLKLVLRAPGDSVPVVGDFLPAVAGIALGGLILLDTLRSPPDDGDPAKIDKMVRAVTPYRTPLGIVGVAVAIVHFLLPTLVIL